MFLWLLLNNSVLPKVGLKIRKWKGATNCSCCGLIETTNHIFFECPLACFTWRVIQNALNIYYIPSSADRMFGDWINNFNKSDKKLVVVVSRCYGQSRE